MTCIIGMRAKNKIFMGGDSCGADNYTNIISHPKIFTLSGFLIGYTTSFRMGQIIQYNFKPPLIDPLDGMEYIAGKFVPALRIALKDGGYSTINNNVETMGEILVGWRGQIYRIQEDFAVLTFETPYNVIGHGEYHASGALAAMIRFTDLIDREPAVMIESALRIAAKFSPYVHDPFYVLEGGESNQEKVQPKAPWVL